MSISSSDLFISCLYSWIFTLYDNISMAPPPLSQLVAVASLQLTLSTSSAIPVQDNSSITGPGEEKTIYTTL